MLGCCSEDVAKGLARVGACGAEEIVIEYWGGSAMVTGAKGVEVLAAGPTLMFMA